MRQLLALINKEFLQIIRDPSAILIAFVLPLILLFIFGYGVNLDNNRIKIGLVLEDLSPSISSLSQAFTNSNFFDVHIAQDKRELENLLVLGHLRGLVVIPQNFTRQLSSNSATASIQVIADGSEPNVANFVHSYVTGATKSWINHQIEDRGLVSIQPRISIEERFWYNPNIKSRNFLVPGSIALIMTLIGTLLTALVIAREWERGTMEALLATPITISQILLGKLIPYFFLGIGSMLICFLIATLWYEVPYRGSLLAILLSTTVFLLAALGQGLLISTVAKNQFVACQIALMSAYLPAFMLSGFIFEIASMPIPIQWITNIFAAKYFVTSLQTLFLAGNIWHLLVRCMLAMLIIGICFFMLIIRKTSNRLDS